jgi:hypothetical protein
MMLFRTGFLLIFFSFLLNDGLTQNLELTHQQKTKIIKTGTYLKLKVAKPGQDPCMKDAGKIIYGRLIGYDQGILKMQISHINDRPVGDSLAYYYTCKVFSEHFELPIMEIKKEDVTSIVIKGKNKSRKHTTGSTIGMVIAVIGIGHLASAPIVGEDDAGLLVGLGLAEFFGGILISSAFKQPLFITYPGCLKVNDPGKKTWEIK